MSLSWILCPVSPLELAYRTSNSWKGRGCMKFPEIWYSSPPQFLNFLIFFPKISVPCPSSLLDNHPYSLNIIEQMILFPPILFFHVIFFPKALKFSYPLKNLKFFPKGFDNLPPPRGPPGGGEELYIPLWKGEIISFKLDEVTTEDFSYRLEQYIEKECEEKNTYRWFFLK